MPYLQENHHLNPAISFILPTVDRVYRDIVDIETFFAVIVTPLDYKTSIKILNQFCKMPPCLFIQFFSPFVT